jgi:hypothetical protein
MLHSCFRGPQQLVCSAVVQQQAGHPQWHPLLLVHLLTPLKVQQYQQ